MSKMRKRLFLVYCLGMLWLLFARARPVYDSTYREQLMQNLNLHPFATIRLYWRLLLGDYSPYLRRHALINLAGNVVLFMPLGIFLPQRWPKLKGLCSVGGVTAGIILVVEMLQLVTLRGSCDVDDVILNVLGACLGYGVYALVSRGKQRKNGETKSPEG